MVGQARTESRAAQNSSLFFGYGAKPLEIEIRYGQALTVLVRDNGAGMDPAVTDHGKARPLWPEWNAFRNARHARGSRNDCVFNRKARHAIACSRGLKTVLPPPSLRLMDLIALTTRYPDGYRSSASEDTQR
jgi:hypothetical protein